jgi:K+-sensing histidine kinase KdpD
MRTDNVERIIVDSMKRFIYVLMYRHWSNSKKKKKIHTFIVLSYWSSVLSMINRSIHSLMFMLIVLISINVFKVVNALLLIMKSIELLMLCIHFIFVIFRRSYDCRKFMTLIMRHFFWIVSSLTRQSYSDLKSMHKTKDTNRSRIADNVALRAISRSKSWANAYNSAARTLRMTRLHLINDQWTILTCFESARQMT